jgi:hypothetical protein
MTASRRIFSAFAAVLFLSFLVQGCAKHVPHPGSVDTFDSRTYDVLTVSQAVLDQSKEQYSTGALSGDTAKEAINKAGELYNEVRDLWLAYRGMKQAGQDATAKVQAIQNLVPQLNQAIADLQTLIK